MNYEDKVTNYILSSISPAKNHEESLCRNVSHFNQVPDLGKPNHFNLRDSSKLAGCFGGWACHDSLIGGLA